MPSTGLEVLAKHRFNAVDQQRTFATDDLILLDFDHAMLNSSNLWAIIMDDMIQTVNQVFAPAQELLKGDVFVFYIQECND